MVYEYECNRCGKREDVCKSVKDFERVEKCEECASPMRVCLSAGYFSGEKVQDAYFNHGLGQVVSSDQEAKQIAKDRGLIEIGNETPKKHITPPKRQKYMDEELWQA